MWAWAEITLSRGSWHLRQLDERNADRVNRGAELPLGPGMHALPTLYPSWCIKRKTDEALEQPAKVVQERLGHAPITMTVDDVYGHLFPRGDDREETEAAEWAFLGS
jgi:integrase